MAKKQTTGWISLHRQIQNHWIWNDPKKFQCWMDILFAVNIEDKKINIGVSLFDCKRGQSLMSYESWAKRWKVSKSAARNLLKLLSNGNMITLENISKSTRLTVCNYDSYQVVAHDAKPLEKRKKTDGHTQLNNITSINININKELSDFEKAFEDFLSMRRKIKKPATERAIQLLNNKLEKLSDGDEFIKIQILEQSILNGWQDVFALRVETFKQQKINGHVVVDQSGNKEFFGV